MSSLQRNLLRKGLPKPPSPEKTGNPGPTHKHYRPCLTPLNWSDFFESKEYVRIGTEDIFCVYKAYTHLIKRDMPIMVFIHGGGYSGLSWAETVRELKEYAAIPVVAIDLRGHGESMSLNEKDLSPKTLAGDVLNVIKKLRYNEYSLIFVGHSLGGSLAIHLASQIEQEDEMTVRGLIVVDVVEGSALNAIPNLSTVLRNRPTQFKSLDDGIEWSSKTGYCRNSTSARVSFPGQLKYIHNGIACSSNINPYSVDTAAEASLSAKPIFAKPLADTILEEDESDAMEKPRPESSLDMTNLLKTNKNMPCTWRADLDRADIKWDDWFTGLSQMFLGIQCPRFLILAGMDRLSLDKDLTVAHMQGKFQVQVVDRVGHTVHEDNPTAVAKNLAQFLIRNELIDRPNKPFFLMSSPMVPI